ncbi:RNA polymerase factor sigma-54 [Methylophilaceae bacterium]|jgi:RNA polymerase sigma-54 factor|nr:RNA polymerase factor sigma-54 [Methylophilaceae bacterium]|tara:strand:- start:13122 stop:14462 length:1341 start_codon:yes stop_codon:yes gene_type:complete
MKLSFNLRLSQSLRLTPLLQQSIKLLQASQSELNQLIGDYINDNIFLELEDSVENNLASQTNFNNSNEASLKNDYSYELFDTQIKNQTLKEYLIENLSIFSFSDRDQIILLILIDSINDEGYLIESLEKIIEIIPFEPRAELKELENILILIQNSSSPGIGARNLSECLCLQLKIIKGNIKLINRAEQICREFLNLLGNKNYTALKNNLNCDDKELKETIMLIKSLNPKPGLIFQRIQPQDFIKADSKVEKFDNNWEVSLIEDNSLRLKINDEYQEMIMKKSSKFDKEAKDKYQEAKWLIKNLRERSITIVRVSRAIMQKQSEFLEKGQLFLKPLILKNISEELDLHESTISRITTNKFISTPHGIFELKYFFGSTIKNDDGNALSSKAILFKIKELIKNEDSDQPLSDKALSILLKDEGIQVARRTIAKYRIALKILPSNQRKNI